MQGITYILTEFIMESYKEKESKKTESKERHGGIRKDPKVLINSTPQSTPKPVPYMTPEEGDKLRATPQKKRF